MARWYVPSICGDFRLESAEDGAKAMLTVSDPTPGEVERLRAFLVAARQREWVSADANVRLLGTTTIPVDAPVADAGAVLVDAVGAQGPGRISAVRSSAGVIAITETAIETANALTRIGEEGEAVSVRRPTPCCPEPVAGPERRASEVLRAFCSPVQWASWIERGFLLCLGAYTGHTYRLAHRNSALAVRQGRICADLDDRAVLHFHDSLLPAPEEVLAAKLILEHREDWLRNPSTCLSSRFREVFRNPLGPQALDGVRDANIVSAFGALFGGVQLGLMLENRGRRCGVGDALTVLDPLVRETLHTA